MHPTYQAMPLGKFIGRVALGTIVALAVIGLVTIIFGSLFAGLFLSLLFGGGGDAYALAVPLAALA